MRTKKGKVKIQALVTLIRPEGATVDDVRRYIGEAVAGWHGSLEPPNDNGGDPMFLLDGDSVKVTACVIKRRSNALKL